MTLELSRLKPNDYEILDSGNYIIPGKVNGIDSPEFGLAATDYIEMIISTPTGVFLDSFVIARGNECTQYKTLDEKLTSNMLTDHDLKIHSEKAYNILIKNLIKLFPAQM